MKISIYGIGNFGFAILKHLSTNLALDNKYRLFAYDRNKKLINNLQRKRKHLYHHKNIGIKKNVVFTHNSRDIFQNTDVIILAVTSNAIIEVLNKNKQYINQQSIILNTAKALEYRSGKCFSEIITKITEIKNHKCSYAVLSGGTIASDLLHHEPLGVDVASKDKKALRLLKKIFTSENLNVYTTNDVKGVEYAGAFKNIISILAGIVHGLGFSYGSETHFITRASYEITQLIKKKIPINHYTFSMYSQCWGNDLWMSCTGQTRNREFGILIGRGYSPNKSLKIMKKKHKSVEGIQTIRALNKFKLTNKFPVLIAIQKIVLNNRNPKRIIWQLMQSNKI